MKKNASTIILIILFLIGLSLLLYPTFADYWNSLTQSAVVASYIEQVALMDDDTYESIWREAKEYNAGLLERYNNFTLTEEQAEKYDALLNIGGDGVMGYIEIPSIDVHLPIYHGTDDAVCRSPLAIWNGPACLSAARAPTVSFPATGACPPHGCSLTLTSLKRATISC